MAFDDFDLVVPPDYGDRLCFDCARALMSEHPDWDDPEDEDGNMTPIFDLDEIPYLLNCGNCGAISTYGSFGPEAVDYGIELIETAIAERRRTDYLDTYADRLTSCVLGSDEADEDQRRTLIEQYRALPQP